MLPRSRILFRALNVSRLENETAGSGRVGCLASFARIEAPGDLGEIAAHTKENPIAAVMAGKKAHYLLELELPYPVNGSADRLLHPAHVDDPATLLFFTTLKAISRG